MTDDLTPAHTPTDDPFVQTPTAAWAHDIEARLADLEEAPAIDPAPAGLTPEQEDRILTALRNLDERLTRHRADIDAVKQHQNDLINYLEQHLPAGGTQ